VRAAVVTVSTSRAAGEGGDEGGDALAEFAAGLGAESACATGQMRRAASWS